MLPESKSAKILFRSPHLALRLESSGTTLLVIMDNEKREHAETENETQKRER